MSTTPTPMGIGSLGNVTFRNRKYRWTISAEFPSGTLPESFVKLASHPDLSDESQKVVVTTFYEYEDSKLKPLWDICSAIYKLAENNDIQSPEYAQLIKDLMGTVTLKMYDSCGIKLDEYILKDAWPWSINFGDLDHSSCDETTIEVTWKYGSCEFVPAELPSWNTNQPPTDVVSV